MPEAMIRAFGCRIEAEVTVNKSPATHRCLAEYRFFDTSARAQ